VDQAAEAVVSSDADVVALSAENLIHVTRPGDIR
jgi:hypothetical protein